MSKQRTVESKPMAAIRKVALQYPEVEEGPSCVNRAFKARKKSFLFLGMKEDTYNVRLKLQASLEEAEQLAAQSPQQFNVGAHGWTLVTLPHTEHPPKGLLERWIDESFRLLAPPALVKTLPEAPRSASRKSAKKKAPRKKTAEQ